MKIHYVSGSRADFGLMKRTLQTLSEGDLHDVGVIVTGQNTVSKYGNVIDEIRDSGLNVLNQIPVCLSGSDGQEMILAMATELAGFSKIWTENRPDLVLLLGDRGEMLAAALAAIHLGVHVGHIHGGERSGTLDDSFRHAISKLSHFHFAATDEARDRLASMGENPHNIWTIGAPGLVGLTSGIVGSPDWLREKFRLESGKPLAFVVFHPVVQDKEIADQQMATIVEALQAKNCATLILRPNSDAGGEKIDRFLDSIEQNESLRIERHLQRDIYCRTLASCDFLIGNSSSGIIESASFDIPTVNVGNRQNDRQRNDNTIDCVGSDIGELHHAIDKALVLERPFSNVYGDGRADQKLLAIMDELDLSRQVLHKRNRY